MSIELPIDCPFCEAKSTADNVISEQKKKGVVHKIQCPKCNFSKVFSIDTE